MTRGGTRTTTAARQSPRFTQADVRAAVAGLRGPVFFQAPLREYTSFKIGGPADVVVEPIDIEDVCLVVQQARARKVPLFVVGGTNLLIRDGGIRGIVVSLVRLRAIKEEPGHVLYAEGGVGMPTLIGYAIKHSLAGLEWAAGIPGTVAGCVVMNAGTKLGEMKDGVKAVCMVNLKGQIVHLEAGQILFEYRRARLPRGIVVGVWLQLKQGVRSEIEKVVKDYLHYRRDTQPLAMPNAGCVFKNPPNDSAGRLIETVGLKGARVGDAEVSTKHANFMVNRGQARAADVIALIGKVRSAIRRRAGVRLDLELKIVGEA
ncbi:MAG: UDP-N-acetylmuramate dehydrogenase [Nitrospira sp.]|nr:UDP-N-acetylmuramate dehydrogenase [Nitrospira sp.]GBL39385.1 UDP-N-acetylenolpyruvoylglucosamine reductase [Nitrospirota bacterium]MBP0121857.1 UDP-N-acetylmuramate dehydrogenase [Nitrospira sp.]MBP0125090.1 UDP-N-acetylmuramate dehydrogenase [Nitrospira sp.]MBP0127948.1 UDP-N-acetylmuramate dehydrogenase [Nitrospira sp.]